MEEAPPPLVCAGFLSALDFCARKRLANLLLATIRALLQSNEVAIQGRLNCPGQWEVWGRECKLWAM